MELSEDITKFPFEINDGNYDRWMNNINPDQTVEVPYSMAIREEAKSGYYPIKFKIRTGKNGRSALMEYNTCAGHQKDKEDRLSDSMPEKTKGLRPVSSWTALRRIRPGSWRARILR